MLRVCHTSPSVALRTHTLLRQPGLFNQPSCGRRCNRAIVTCFRHVFPLQSLRGLINTTLPGNTVITHKTTPAPPRDDFPRQVSPQQGGGTQKRNWILWGDFSSTSFRRRIAWCSAHCLVLRVPLSVVERKRDTTLPVAERKHHY